MSRDRTRERTTVPASGMSVHSLIGRFQEAASASQAPLFLAPSSLAPPSLASSHQPASSIHTSIPSSHPTAKSEGHTPVPPDISSTGLLSLLGPSVSSFPYSEQAYIESVKLRSEQERTKQEFYKLEIASKNLTILQNALRAQIPVNLIPLMCVGDLPPAPVPPQASLAPLASHQQPQTKTTPVQTPKPVPIPVISEELEGKDASHSRSSSRDFDITPTGPPIGFKFGGGPSPTLNPSRRPLLPAKIGAAAVANLALPTTPYRSVTSNTRKTRHSRHYSMPVESSSRSTRSETQAQKAKGSTTGPGATSGAASGTPAASQASQAQGGTSTIQVNPVPAQPLHKQSKLNQPPSQESMTSFQHIIQFHHWKPEGPGQGPNIGLGNPFRVQPQLQPPQNTHKRHKSSSESVPGEGPTTPFNPQVERERNTNDTIEEETSMTMDSTIDDLNSADTSLVVPRDDPNEDIVDASSNPPGHRRQLLNVGRYPHDILSPYTR
ncbi:uncharacterized protein CANTADRAFT_8527 [Suhomyces tanzawaensis NRRL Y-17324]|uniref:Uncharacterized protein n=1 Tax=Suhomyces tanzawaensis NRRL Y-17324 TaxID=984487 RepID=A0A1E4SAV1_9ASCO|nr:uncharacterized protein CANTADRAFT_8527 [Suhomyces tanzawaensis NRRL Y-17324]ODV76633.1 hypothetical protein CANTADRAFT_8527 [Suhomyces tanzawaensis NRRL Y-17324]